MPISSNTAVLTRGRSRADGTAGEMVLHNHKGQTLEQVILELPDLLNAASISRFNAGAYLCKLSYSNTFKRELYMVMDVEGRSGIRFHRGNWAGTAALGKNNSKGCPLQGYSLTYDRTNFQQMITDSANAEKDMIRFFGGQDFVLIVQ